MDDHTKTAVWKDFIASEKRGGDDFRYACEALQNDRDISELARAHALYLVALRYHGAENWKDAKSTISRSLVLVSDVVQSSNLLGSCLLNMSALDNAIAVLRRAIGHSTVFPGGDAKQEKAFVHANLAQAWKRKGEYSRAVVETRMAMKLIPGSERINIQLADLLFLDGRIDEAKIAYDAAIGKFAKSARAYANRGWLLFKAGDSKAALADYDRALVLDPDYEHARRTRQHIADQTEELKRKK